MGLFFVMQNFESSHRDRTAEQSAVRVLEILSHSARVAFDAILARRVLAEAERAIPGNDPQAWSRRIVETGESLNLRVRSVDASIRDAVGFVKQGLPVAICCQAADGSTRWQVITECKGRRLRLTTFDPKAGERWISIRRLPQSLGLPWMNSHARWVIGQSALACQSPGRDTSQRQGTRLRTPISRVVGLLRPEKKDLWIVLIFSLVVGMLALATPIAVEALVNTVAFGRYLQPVLILALILFTFLAFAAAMRALITYVVELLQRRLFVRVIEDLAYRLPRVQQQEFDSRHGPELVNRFFDVVTLQKTASALLLDGVQVILQTVIGMAVLAFYHPFLLGFDVVLLGLVAFTIFGLGRGAVASAVKESKAKYAIAAWLEELARHPTAFKMHSGSQFALQRADQLAIRWLDTRRAHFHVVMRQIIFALGLQAVAGTALLGLGGWLVILGELTLGQLVAAELIVMMIVGSFAKLGKHMESFYDLLASADKLGLLFDLGTEPHDKLFHLRQGVPAEIRVRDLTHSFGAEPVFQDLELVIAAGECVALVGPPGCGKSTLVDLLCGLRSPTSGHIELDGIDLRELRPDSLREHLALARHIEVFAGTIDENVHLNRSEISAGDVRSALDDVGLLDELLKLPDGMNTVLQTGGAPLSSSQSLRLMLARAICGRPRLMLIDGTLDGLPDDTIAELLANLARKDASWTLVIVTGRPAVMNACDRVVSMGAGGHDPAFAAPSSLK